MREDDNEGVDKIMLMTASSIIDDDGCDDFWLHSGRRLYDSVNAFSANVLVIN